MTEDVNLKIVIIYKKVIELMSTIDHTANRRASTMFSLVPGLSGYEATTMLCPF